ncbi:hypothetical protein ABT160_02555 [Streptomyces sp. NPDC001941]|uniref:hypothetical protein n=1 Tax=Streptomyces sp. NPDC001941 TaxID=3154659 RepID=UPI00332942A0
MTTPCPAGCGRQRQTGRYLDLECWSNLTARTRRALSRRDSKAHARLRELHTQLAAGVPLSEIEVTP